MALGHVPAGYVQRAAADAVILRHLHSTCAEADTALYDVGDMPYRLARPLLQQCRPLQLRAIEEASPVRWRS